MLKEKILIPDNCDELSRTERPADIEDQIKRTQAEQQKEAYRLMGGIKEGRGLPGKIANETAKILDVEDTEEEMQEEKATG